MIAFRRRTIPFRWIGIWSSRRRCKSNHYRVLTEMRKWEHVIRDKQMLMRCRSGELNAKNRELLALQAQARARLAKTRANFSEGMKAARDVQRDLEWTQKKVQ